MTVTCVIELRTTVRELDEFLEFSASIKACLGPEFVVRTAIYRRHIKTRINLRNLCLNTAAWRNNARRGWTAQRSIVPCSLMPHCDAPVCCPTRNLHSGNGDL